MTSPTAPAPHTGRDARIIGALYVVLFVLGPMVFLNGKGAVLVLGDPSATADRVRAMGEAYRWGMGIEAVIILIEVLLSGLLYVMFRGVHRTVAFAAALARFGEATIQGANLLTSALVLGVVFGGTAVAALSGSQQDILIYLFQQANSQMILVWGLFFGLHVLLLSWLVYWSGFLPRWIGVLLMGSGAGYLAQSLGVLLIPAAASLLDVVVIVLAVPGELAFTLWLLIKGVQVPRMSTP